VIKTEGTNVYYDNREFVFAVYSYDFFITMVNDAIRTLYLNSGIADDPPFFAYDHDSEKISFYQSDANVVYFSMNLFPYVGEGFNTTWYYIRPPLIDADVYSINIENNVFIQKTVEINGVNFIKMTQEYHSMSSWASINRILFVSNKLPIKREFYPVSSSVGILNTTQQSYENLMSMNIICSFLFASTNAGDYRTNLVYSNSDVDVADVIDMTHSGMVRELDVEVKWSDKYGNVYPIRLGVNKQVNIRFAFIKRV